MSFEHIKPQKGYELVMTQLRSQIDEGILQPGQKLASVVELAERFGVGRSTVREALSALRAIGYVRIHQGGGTYVMDKLPSPKASDLFADAESFKEMLEVRLVLESGCAALAAVNRSGSDLERLQSILGTMGTALDDEMKSEEADAAFHLAVARASGNALLLQLMESLSMRLRQTMRESRQLWFYGERTSAERLYQEHRSIYEAIRERDEQAAVSRMRAHLHKVEAVLRSMLAAK